MATSALERLLCLLQADANVDGESEVAYARFMAQAGKLAAPVSAAALTLSLWHFHKLNATSVTPSFHGTPLPNPHVLKVVPIRYVYAINGMTRHL